MTRLQVRAGDQSVIIDGQNLIVSLQGLFKLEATDDLTILEVPAAAATDGLESIEAHLYSHNASLKADLESLRETARQRILSRDRVIQDQASTIEFLKATSRDEFQLGRNIRNETVQSDVPNKRGPYRVSLFEMPSGFVRGTCQCMDWYLHGLGSGDLTYRCKHITNVLHQTFMKTA